MGKGSRQNHGGKSKNQRREESERKRDERAQRHALRKEKQASQFGIDDGEFKSFRNQLQKQGLKMRDVLGDGNCLFRALSDQMDGNETMHKKHRTDVVKYMTEHEDEFAPFLEETVSYKNYLKDLSSQGTYGGNDSIVAFARANNVDVVIHQHNSPTFIVEGNSVTGEKVVVHLAYHDFEHYSSVRRTSDPCNGPAFMHHQESDSVASRKVVDVDNADATTSDGSVTSRKSKRKEKKEAQASTVEISKVDDEDDAFISEAVEEIKTKSGIEDTKYVRDIFEENSYDIDASLTYVLQTMHLGIDSNSPGCSKNCNLQDVEQKQAQPQKDEKIIRSHDENDDFISEAVEEIKMRSGLEDTKYVRDIFEDNSYDVDASLTYIFQTMHLGYDDKNNDAGCSKEPEEEPVDGTVDATTKEQVVSKETSEDEDEDEDSDEDVDDDEKGGCCCACDDTTFTNCNCNGPEERRGRRNLPMKKNEIQTRQTQGGKKHLSNRQRKELAKQDRKKRRQETRRADGNTKEKQEEDKPNEPIQSINI